MWVRGLAPIALHDHGSQRRPTRRAQRQHWFTCAMIYVCGTPRGRRSLRRLDHHGRAIHRCRRRPRPRRRRAGRHHGVKQQRHAPPGPREDRHQNFSKGAHQLAVAPLQAALYVSCAAACTGFTRDCMRAAVHAQAWPRVLGALAVVRSCLVAARTNGTNGDLNWAPPNHSAPTRSCRRHW